MKSEREARDEAERQSRLKDEFLATLSHELRTPMNAILGWLSILESGKPIREIHSALAVIAKNARIQGKLIDDLLDMNRLISGNVQLDVARVDVGALLQTTMQSLQPAADARGRAAHRGRRLQCRRYRGRFAAAAAGDVESRPQRHQVLPNQGRVEIRVQRTPEGLQIVVKDNGQGISPSFLPHVFERFRQQDASSTRAAFGLGLGLSIAKHIVELHGGHIAAHSAGEGQGATFMVRMPAVPRPASAGTTADTRMVRPPDRAIRSVSPRSACPSSRTDPPAP